MNFKIGIITVGQFDLIPKRQHGSTHLRVESLVSAADNFEIWKHGRSYDGLIFQKVYWRGMLELFKGPKILDLTDPDWLKGICNINEIGSLADAITCSSNELTAYLAMLFPSKIVRCIPDRLNFDFFIKTREQHTGIAKHVLWFGYAHNAVETLPQMASVLKDKNLDLTLVSERNPREIESLLDYTYVEYNRDTINELIQKSDMVLNPRSENALFKYKSNNKTVIGWNLGVPVAETPNDVILFMGYESRNKEVAEREKIISSNYNILKSADQYQEIVELIMMDKQF